MASASASESLPEEGARRAPPRKLSKMDMLKRRVREDPAVFGFLGLTVAALTGGLFSLMRDNKKQGQLMMRFRVFFQFCAVSSLVGGIYYRAYQGKLAHASANDKPTRDNRVFLTDPLPALEPIAEGEGKEKAQEMR